VHPAHPNDTLLQKETFSQKEADDDVDDVKQRRKNLKMKIISGRQMKAPNNNQTN
jgi:hypothetical protein